MPRYWGSARDLLYAVSHTENDAYATLQLMEEMDMLPLSLQLTRLGGNLWDSTLNGGRAERIEYLLLHEFHRKDYIVPDKERAGKKSMDGTIPGRGKKGRGKPAFKGGKVLEPKRGLYDKCVLLLDFNSLYPSIIQGACSEKETKEGRKEGRKRRDPLTTRQRKTKHHHNERTNERTNETQSTTCATPRSRGSLASKVPAGTVAGSRTERGTNNRKSLRSS